MKGYWQKTPRGRGGIGRKRRGGEGAMGRGEKKKKDEILTASKIEASVCRLRCRLGPSEFQKTSQCLFIRVLFFIRFTVHFSRLTDFNI
jgi:hypothetical protein